MEVLSIGITAPTTSLRHRLIRELKFLLDEGVAVDIQESRGSSYHKMTLSLAAAPRSGFSVGDLLGLGRQYAAHVLAEYLLEEREQHLLRQLVDKDCKGYASEEQARILALAHKILRGEGRVQLGRHAKLRERLSEFLENHRHINPEGFLRFRWPHYFEDLRQVVARAVDEYAAEREYLEFVRLLRYFVEIQEPKLPLVHVSADANGFCQVYDATFRQLYHEYLGSFDEEDDHDVSYEDLVISALITMAPRHIILHRHGSSRAGMYNTIRHIFDARATDCHSCELCLSSTSSPRESSP